MVIKYGGWAYPSRKDLVMKSIWKGNHQSTMKNSWWSACKPRSEQLSLRQRNYSHQTGPHDKDPTQRIQPFSNMYLRIKMKPVALFLIRAATKSIAQDLESSVAKFKQAICGWKRSTIDHVRPFNRSDLDAKWVDGTPSNADVQNQTYPSMWII